jgi:2-iminobutanoate/2-iminopropanoate deaminase
MNMTSVYTAKAPEPIGPYAQAILCGDMLYLSGQIALDPSTGVLTGNTVEQQTIRVLANIEAILETRGLTCNNIVKNTVYLKSMDDFAAFNAVYDRILCGWKPARSVVEVARLPKNALVEIEAVACR